MEKFRSFSKDLQGMSSDNGKGGSVNANEQTIFQLIKDFRLAREADEAMKLRAREQRDGSSSGSGGRSSRHRSRQGNAHIAPQGGRGIAGRAVGRSGAAQVRGRAQVFQNCLIFLG